MTDRALPEVGRRVWLIVDTPDGRVVYWYVVAGHKGDRVTFHDSHWPQDFSVPASSVYLTAGEAERALVQMPLRPR